MSTFKLLRFNFVFVFGFNFYFLSSSTSAQIDEYYFDTDLIKTTSNENYAYLSKTIKSNNLMPGVYKVDLYLNGVFIKKLDINFYMDNENKLIPCWNFSSIESLNLNEEIIMKIKNDNLDCIDLNKYVADYSSRLKFENLRLDVSIPQISLINIPRGYVDPDEWEFGENIGFINYSGSIYHTKYNTNSNTAAYMSFNGGVNFGKWQYRQISSLVYDQNDEYKWNNIKNYITRPLIKYDGVLSLGQMSTSGRLFSGMTFDGLNFTTDERMIPESKRGYAPVIQGIAKTNAKISIYQNDREIYQTNVSPGAFKIDDLYSTFYNGDLVVKVLEADGSQSEFTVPFSALPETLRAGLKKYNFDIGRTNSFNHDSLFANLTYQVGINNNLTFNTGSRIGDGYLSGLLGGTYMTKYGAIGSDFTFSKAKINDMTTLNGWMGNITFSKFIKPTNTTISLAGYRYSTDGYRELADVLGIRDSQNSNLRLDPSINYQRSRFEINLNQNLDKYGMLFISGASQVYKNKTNSDYQLQIGYGKSFANSLNLNMALVKKYFDTSYESNIKNSDMSLSMSLSFPIGHDRKSNKQNLDIAYSESKNSEPLYQGTISGNIGSDQTMNYSATLSHDENYGFNSLALNLNNKFDNFSLGLNSSLSKEYWQTSGNIQGGMALHSKGITFGPYLNGTFALVEAQGAEGAHVFNGNGSKINRKGFAIVPNLVPYRYNDISLDPKGISNRVEIEESSHKIAPVAGAGVKVKFKTRIGIPLIIQAKLLNGEYVPMGSDVVDENNNSIGMVGQSGQTYIKVERNIGLLKLIWGESTNEQCLLNYSFNEKEHSNEIYSLDNICKMVE